MAKAKATTETVEPRSIDSVVKEATKTLVDKAKDLYYQDGKLISVVVYRDKITSRQVKVKDLQLKLHKYEPTSTWPDIDRKTAANHILYEGNLDSFNLLTELSSVPVLRPDFTLVPPGYDETTGVLYAPSDVFRNHTFNLDATPADAKAAYTKLLYCFADFPFKGNGQANIIAFILSLLTRSATKFWIPFLAISATHTSTGKSLIAKSISLIVQGKPSYDIGADKGGSTEVEKKITAVLIGNDRERLIHIDNIDKVFHSALLASLGTSSNAVLRKYGTHDLPPAYKKPLVILNGNKLKVSTDIAKRCVYVVMWHENTKHRDPHKFQVYQDHGEVDLDKYLESSWLEYYDAAMTIVQAWRNAGMPKRKPSSALDKYPQWESTIGGMLEFCGETTFLGDHAIQLVEMDDQEQELRSFYDAWWAEIKEVRTTGSSLDVIVSTLMDNGPGNWNAFFKSALRDVQGETKETLKNNLGKFLARHLDETVVSPYILKKAKKEPGNVYILVKTKPDAPVVPAIQPKKKPAKATKALVTASARPKTKA